MIEVHEKGNTAVVRFASNIDRLNVATLSGTSLSEVIAGKTDKVRIVLNLEKIDYLDSAALGRLMGIYAAVAPKKGALALACANKNIAGIINMLTINRVIRLFDTEEEAVRSLSS